MSEFVKVTKLPPCDFGCGEAVYDACIRIGFHTGRWAYMCEAKYQEFGRGLGTGLGQRLILEEKEV